MPTRAETVRDLSEGDYPGLGRYVWRPAKGALDWSAALLQIYGLSVQPASEAGFLACLHPDDRTRVEGETESFLTGDADSYSHSFRILRPNGEVRYILDRAVIERDSKHRITRISGVNIDLTAFPHLAVASMDNESRQSEASAAPRDFHDRDRLEIGQRTSGLALADIDYRAGTFALSKAAARLFGFGLTATTVPRDAVHATFHPEDRAALEAEIRAALDPATGGKIVTEHRILLPDGAVRWLRVRKRIDFAMINGRLQPDRGILAAIDITARKEAETAVQESADRLRVILDKTVALVGVLDPDGTLREANQVALAVGGLARQDVIGKAYWEAPWWTHDPGEVARLRDAVARAAAGEQIRYDARIMAAGGTLRYIDFSISPVHDESGKVTLLVPSALDITERMRAEAELRASQAKLTLFVAHAPAAIAMFDAQMRYIAHSHRFLTDYGLPADSEIIGQSHWDVFPQMRANLLTVHARVLQGETHSADEDQFTRASGQIDYVRWTMAPWYADDGAVGGAILFTEVITDRVEARQALRHSEARYRALFNSINAGFCVIEMRFDRPHGRTDYRVLEANPAFYERTGFPRAIFGQWLREAAPALEEHWYEIYGGVARTGTPARFEEYSKLLGRWFDVFAFQIDEPEKGHVAILFHDISERRRHEEHVRTLLKEVNHRSKNMLSLVNVIARRTASMGSEGFIERFSQRIGALATNQDILVRSEWQQIPLEELVRSQLAHFQDLLDRRISISGPPLAILPAAAEKLGMALHELATNASKYGALASDVGRIVIEWQAGPAEDARFVLIWREAGGPPVVPPAKTGFGSLVSGRILEVGLNGAVQADYAPGGLSWRLSCPLAEVAGEAPAAEKPALIEPRSSRGLTVLVVEDEALIAMSLADTLMAAGFGVAGPVGTVASALDQIARGQPDFVILDITLGQETSGAVAAELKRIGTPFICVTGYSADQLPEAFREVPLLTKPYDERAVLLALDQHFGARTLH